MNTKLLIQGFVLSTMMVSAHLVSAASFDLCTGVTTKTMPDATSVVMWGFGLEDNTAGCDSAIVPGPQLVVPDGDTVLTINLRNTLAETTSIMITGLSSPTPPSPAFITDGQGRLRHTSMTQEAAENGGTKTYQFNVAPGTYLYQSGSHPAVQVQMGLYGGVTNDTLTGEAYPSVAYDNEVMLLYSEIDPGLHAAVAGGTYGTAPYKTTINYVPKYFLVNGSPFVGGATADINGGVVGETTLIRFINAGLETHVPLLHGGSMELIAEYGSKYPYSRKQYSFELAAGQSRDALFTPDATGRYAIYDRRLRLTNNTTSEGGLMSFLAVTSGLIPTAVTLESPSGNLALNNMPTYKWIPQVGATNYKLWIKDPNGVVTQTWYTPAVADCVGAATICSVSTATALANGNYSWKVRARNTIGLGPWSTTLNFAIGVPPVTPTLNSPSGSLGANNIPTYRWFRQDNATNYKLWIKNPLGVVSQIWYTPVDANCSGTQVLCTITEPAPLGDGSYIWKVRTANTAGMSPWSSTLSFTIGVPPVAPTLNSPSGNLGASNLPTFEWVPQAGVTNYKLWIKDSLGVVSQIWHTPTAANCAASEPVCTILTTTALSNGNYSWKVRSRNNIGLGPWSAQLQFNVLAP